MSFEDEVRALRTSVGLSLASHVALVRVDGPDALDFLQLASTQSPYARVGRVRTTLLLRDDGSIFADAFIVNLGDFFLVLAEGPESAEIVAWLTSLKTRSKSFDVSIRGIDDEWAVLGVDGPYAWELVSQLFGAAVLGMPYLSVLARDETICIRAGKTGEYGYLLLVPRPALDATLAELVERGGPLDAARVGLAALDLCALESWHFTMRTLRRTETVETVTPIELQLQWRVVYAREFVGAEALRARKAEGAKSRVTCFVADGPVGEGQRVQLEGSVRGEVLAALTSPTLGRTVGAALLDRRVAHPHLALEAMAPAGPLPMRTCSAFLVDNVSLRVQPHLGHTYATRGERA